MVAGVGREAPGDAGTRRRRVAVVAVHGVADQQPCRSARQIADLLRAAAPGEYSAFEETQVRISVEAMAIPPAGDDASLRKFSPLEERTTRLRTAARSDTPPARDVHLDFFLDQVEHYRPAQGETYETPRLSASRGAERSVEVFELYWADLSRLGISMLRIFGELFQIIVHLASLGRHALDQAGAARDLGRGWAAFSWCHRWAVRLLTLPAILFSLLLLVMLPAAWATKLPPGAARGTLAVLAGVAVAAGALFLLRGHHRAIAAFGLGVGAAALVAVLAPADPIRLVVGLALLAAVAAYFWVAIIYNRRRPGATRAAAAVLVFVAAILLAIGAWPPSVASALDRASLQRGILHTAEAVFLANGIVWAAFSLLQLAAWVLGFAWRANGDAATAARRARWTAHVTLASTATALVLAGFVLWSALVPWFLPVLPAGPHVPQWGPFEEGLTDFARWDPVCRPPGSPDLTRCSPAAQTARMFVFASASWILVYVLVLVGGALLLIVWGILPSALWESRLGRLGLRHPERLGGWLDSGFGAAAISGAALLLAIGVLYPAGLVVQLVADSPIADKERTQALIGLIGGSLAATTAALFALRGRAKRFALGLRSPVDVLLDVDNHLRTHPLDGNPRAMIATRATALLRHLAAQNFDAIVFVAHSQGTVVVADVLRFLARHRDPSLGALPPVRFLTMGSPLRQLYALRFPDLYAWAARPHRAELLGVASWVNLYTSGDYVGRNLWRGDDDPDRFDPTKVHDHDGHREACLGAGAHTHYWDGTYPAVATHLDALVRGA